jgi:hypothetical protein
LKEEKEQRKLTQFAIWEKKNLWAMIHNAPTAALEELYHTLLHRFGLSELGNLLRDYLKSRKDYGTLGNLRRCPYCGTEDPTKGDKRAGVGKVTRKEGKKGIDS